MVKRLLLAVPLIALSYSVYELRTEMAQLKHDNQSLRMQMSVMAYNMGYPSPLPLQDSPLKPELYAPPKWTDHGFSR